MRGDAWNVDYKARGPIHPFGKNFPLESKTTHYCTAPNVPLSQARCDQFRRNCKIKHLVKLLIRQMVGEVIIVLNSIE